MINLKHFAQALLSQCEYVEELETENHYLQQRVDEFESAQREYLAMMNNTSANVINALLNKVDKQI